MFQYFIEAYAIFHNITNKSLYILYLVYPKYHNTHVTRETTGNDGEIHDMR